MNAKKQKELTELELIKDKVALAVDIDVDMQRFLFKSMSSLIEYDWDSQFEEQLDEDIDNAY